MEIKHNQYVPVLKWRMGEYQSLFRLDSGIKDLITPLIMIPPREYDFDEERMKKSIHDHIEPFASRYVKKWGAGRALIDFHKSLEEGKMDSGQAVLLYVFDELREKDADAIPVVNFTKSKSYLSDVKKIIAKDGEGVALRVGLEELMNPVFNEAVRDLLGYLEVSIEEVDLIIDLGDHGVYVPYNAFSVALSNEIDRIEHLNAYRSFVLIGTSMHFRQVKKPGGVVDRHEWKFYKELLGYKSLKRKPSFGDYTIEPPGFVEMDMRKIKPPGKIVYGSDDIWFVAKGGAFRGDEKQMKTHCTAIINSGYFKGARYSHGDLRIELTSKGKENTGNLTTWKQAGVSHHLSLVVDQLASFHV